MKNLLTMEEKNMSLKCKNKLDIEVKMFFEDGAPKPFFKTPIHCQRENCFHYSECKYIAQK